jgi:hypothetical protein
MFQITCMHIRNFLPIQNIFKQNTIHVLHEVHHSMTSCSDLDIWNLHIFLFNTPFTSILFVPSFYSWKFHYCKICYSETFTTMNESSSLQNSVTSKICQEFTVIKVNTLSVQSMRKIWTPYPLIMIIINHFFYYL